MPRPTIDIPLAAGLDTKKDSRALEGPYLDVCKNAVFTETGGIQKRRPRTEYPTTFSGGEGISDVRKLMHYDEELLLFTKKDLYSWSEGADSWQHRGRYLAPEVREKSVFLRNNEQIGANRISSGGVTVYTWIENDVTTNYLPNGYIGVIDDETGAVIVPATNLGAADVIATGIRAGAVMVFAGNGNILQYREILPANPAAGLATSWSIAAANYGGFLDVMTSGPDVVVAFTTTSNGEYVIQKHLVGGGFFSESKVSTVYNDMPLTRIRAAERPDSAGYVVGFIGRETGNPTRLVFSYLDLTFDDVPGSVEIAGEVLVLPPPPTDFRFTIAVGADDAATYYYSRQEAGTDEGAFVAVNRVTPSGVFELPANSRLTVGADLASKAFAHCGEIFVWVVFDVPTSVRSSPAPGDVRRFDTQSTYFLLDSAGKITAIAAKDAAGGITQVPGHLPTVQQLDPETYAWAGLERRRVAISGVDVAAGADYADRGPRDIVVEFDSPAARRGIQLGRTLYLTGGMIQQYDGVGLTEAGFLVYPHNLLAQATESATGEIEAGSYTFRSALRWENAKGEVDRSTSGGFATEEVDTMAEMFTVQTQRLALTRKRGERSNIAIEYFRTVRNSGVDSPYYLVSSSDPAALGPDNLYVENDVDSLTGNTAALLFFDALTDEDIIGREVFRESGLVLSNIAPPPASIIEASDDRLFLAGIPNFPNRVWYSKQRGFDEVASFNDILTIDLPIDGGPITGLAYFNNTLIVFKENAIYAVPGQGFDNLGQGNNYGPAQIISTDVGARSADVIERIPDGLVFFGNKGWYLLDRGWTPQYIGAPVEEFNGDDFNEVHVLEREHEIRCLSPDRILVYDLVAQQWSEWEHDTVPIVTTELWNNRYQLAGGDQVFQEDDEHGNPTNYSLQVVTAWLRVAGLSNFQRLRYITLLGEYRSDHGLLIELARDYQDDEWFQVKEFHPECDKVAGDPLQVRHGPKIQKVQAMKIRITDVLPGSQDPDSPPSGESLKLTGLTLEVGEKPGTARIGARRKQ